MEIKDWTILGIISVILITFIGIITKYIWSKIVKVSELESEVKYLKERQAEIQSDVKELKMNVNDLRIEIGSFTNQVIQGQGLMKSEMSLDFTERMRENTNEIKDLIIKQLGK